MSTFFEALAGGMLAMAVLLLLGWLAQRIGLALPRTRLARRRLLCVRPLDFDD